MKKKRYFLNAVLIFLIIIVVSLLVSRTVNVYKFKKSFSELAIAIEEEDAAANLDYSFLIKNLSSPVTEISLQADKLFVAASIIKLPILAAVFKAVDEGKVALSNEIVIVRKDITGGSGKLKARRLPYRITLEKLLELMISVSDNTATNKVIEILGFDYINAAFKELGFSNTILSRKMMDFSSRRKGIENYTSARDISSVLEAIYYGKLFNKTFSDLALSLLKKQKVRDRIPRYLPDNIIIANKTGLERGIVHDAGIIFTSNGDYIICVLVKGAKTYNTAKKFIARISLLSYNLYE